MTYKLLMSKSAKNDLSKILNYISVDLENPKAAKELMDKIDKCMLQLKDNPLMYAKVNDIKLSNAEYRKLPIDNYIIVYRFDKTTNTVRIMRLFFGRRDYLKYL